jgi:hypothetical protein
MCPAFVASDGKWSVLIVLSLLALSLAGVKVTFRYAPHWNWCVLYRCCPLLEFVGLMVWPLIYLFKLCWKTCRFLACYSSSESWRQKDPPSWSPPLSPSSPPLLLPSPPPQLLTEKLVKTKGFLTSFFLFFPSFEWCFANNCDIFCTNKFSLEDNYIYFEIKDGKPLHNVVLDDLLNQICFFHNTYYYKGVFYYRMYMNNSMLVTIVWYDGILSTVWCWPQRSIVILIKLSCLQKSVNYIFKNRFYMCNSLNFKITLCQAKILL